MSASRSEGPYGPDLLSLASAEMPELLAALEDAVRHRREQDDVPQATVQIADIVQAEAIRLIRAGTIDQAADAAVALTRFQLGPAAGALGERDPDAARIVAATTTTLAAASTASSSGSELAVLRRWRGRARALLGLVADAPGQSLPRSELKRRLGINDDHLSLILKDLDDAGLVVRVRTGRSVTVHLGPSGRDEHVRELLADDAADQVAELGRALDLLAVRDARAADFAALDLVAVEREIDAFHTVVQRPRVSIEDLAVVHGRLLWFVRFRGTCWRGPDEVAPVDIVQSWSAHADGDRVFTVVRRSPAIAVLLNAELEAGPHGLSAGRLTGASRVESRASRVGRVADSLASQRAATKDDVPPDANETIVPMWTRANETDEARREPDDSNVRI